MSETQNETPDEQLIELGKATAEVAHELRNFMTAILAGAEFLGRHEDPLVATTAERIQENAALCRSYANHLLSKLRPQDVADECIDLHKFLNTFIEGRHGEAIVRLSPSNASTCTVAGNRARLTSVFENLIRNAEEAARPAQAIVSIDIETANNWHILSVHDSGPGIDEKMKGRLFTEYQTEGKDGGTGIGLALCRKIMAEHNGTITHVDRSAPGATFQLRMPQATSDLFGPAIEGIEDDWETGLTILCIDDDQSTLDTYEMILKLDGHKVTPVGDGASGLDQAKSKQFDVIVCDLRLPDMSGADFLRKLKSQSAAAARKVVFATGDLMNAESQAFLDSAHCPYLIKPFELDELRVAIRVALKSSQQ